MEDMDIVISQEELALKKFLQYNPFESFFKGSFDSVTILCLKLCCKTLRTHLDKPYPPFRHYELKRWIVRTALSKGYWKISAYLFRAWNYQIPEHLKSKFDKTSKFLKFAITKAEDIPYHDEIVKNLFPWKSEVVGDSKKVYTLDSVLQNKNFCLFEANPNVKWRINNYTTCFASALEGSVSALEYLRTQCEFNIHLTCYHVSVGTYETLEWVTKNAVPWMMEDGYDFYPKDPRVFKFVIDNVHSMNFTNPDIALLVTSIKSNDLEYLKSKYPDRMNLILGWLNNDTNLHLLWNEKFVYDHFELLKKHVSMWRMLELLDGEQFLPLIIKLVQEMEDQNVPFHYFPKVLVKHHDLDLIKRIHQKANSPHLELTPPLWTTTFDVFEWMMKGRSKLDINVYSLQNLENWKPKDDPRFLTWLKTESPPISEVEIIPEFPKISMVLMDAFPRRVYIKNYIKDVEDFDLLVFLSKNNHIERHDKIEILEQFHSPEITDYILQDLPFLKEVFIDDGLLRGKVWLLEYIQDQSKPWAKKLKIKDKKKLLEDAAIHHHFHLVQLLS